MAESEIMRRREELLRSVRTVDRRIEAHRRELVRLEQAAGKVTQRVLETGMRDLRSVERR